jgi:hypothetical protein
MSDIHRFNVDDKEVLVSRNWFLGTVKVWINGAPLKTKMPLVGGVKKVDFKVNDKDVNVTVAIPKMFPAFKAWEYTMSVEGNQVANIRK